MLSEALSYARSGDEALKRLLVGGAVQLGGTLLVLPGIFLYGYLLRVLRDAVGAPGDATGDTDTDELPAWDDWETLAVDGLKALLVIFAYLLPVFVVTVTGIAVAVFALPLGAALGSGATGSEAGAAAGTSLFLLVFVGVVLLGTLLSLIVYYLLPAALVGLAVEDDLGAAFRWDALKQVARSKSYFVGMLVAAVVAVAGGLLAAPLVFLLVGFVLQFYVFVVVAHVAGQAVAESTPA
jgi:hypothetical protein